ncbi:hypothetical protein [Vibrio japonicus]|uniref:Arylsulfatase n=1 Tax=Vibrio japonicus TaxID=1824638 RepID=A0ABY5LN41_9VIBR|nr:hypothetical protein [Vibrio japonicus]UUM32325.1 hypothetical protein NP165_18760 [Vibrio japonicus]
MKIAFLYTVRANITLFQPYIDEFLSDSNIQTSHFVDESLLEQAMGNASSHEVENLVHSYIQNIAKQGFDLIVCTCSSIGEYAESTPEISAKVVRIDRPMAEKAIRFQNIQILATAESTVSPTYKLVNQSAMENPLSICQNIEVTIVPDAWQHLNNGDHAAYIQAISKTIKTTLENMPSNGVILLAQASMTPAATFNHPIIPVLSSPIIGVQSLLNYVK